MNYSKKYKIMKNLLLITAFLFSIMVVFALPSNDNLADVTRSNSPNDRPLTSEVTGSTSGNNADDVRLGAYTDRGHQLTTVSDNGAGFGESQTIWVTPDTTYSIRVILKMGFIICLLSLMAWAKIVGG